MEKQILDELKELRAALVKLVGTTDLPKSKQLSSAVLDKAADEFKKLQKQSDGWLHLICHLIACLFSHLRPSCLIMLFHDF